MMQEILISDCCDAHKMFESDLCGLCGRMTIFNPVEQTTSDVMVSISLASLIFIEKKVEKTLALLKVLGNKTLPENVKNGFNSMIDEQKTILNYIGMKKQILIVNKHKESK